MIWPEEPSSVMVVGTTRRPFGEDRLTDAMVAKALDAFTSDKWSSGMDAMRAALEAALAEMWRQIEDGQI